jgi:outer membrane lipoprotein-sorting protein
MLFTFLSTVLLGQAVMAQYDPKAREVLDKMSNKYQEISSFRADVSYSLSNETEDIFEEFQGEITVMGDKYRLLMDGQEIINDGKTLWTFLEDVNEVNISNYDPDEDDISPSKVYNIYKSGYKYSYFSEKVKDGNQYHVIDLVPENKDSQFFKVRLEINKADNSLNNWKMFDRSGNIYEYEVSNFISDLNIKESYFAFDMSAHEGVDVVDLR